MNLYGQSSATLDSGTITINFKELSLQEAISAIEKNIDITFFYDRQKIDVGQKVSLNADSIPIKQAINQMLKPTNVDFEITDTQIALFPRSEQKNGNTLSGQVMDTGSVPLGGVTIVVDGSGNGTVTNDKGRFSLTVESLPVKLNVSSLGYESQQVDVASVHDIKIYLNEDIIKVDDVVVVGYGTQKKVNLTGAVSTVESSQLESRGGRSVSQMLQGMVPGLTITTSSGLPSSNPTINIRGITSINGGSPLVLIDGIEGDMHKVNPNDIESISVLKDASSAAIYGARAPYGVILITTKSAKTTGDDASFKTNVSYSGRWGIGKPTMSTDFETRGYYSAYINDLFMKAYSGNPYTNYTKDDYDELWARRNDKTENPDRPWVVIDQRHGRNGYVYYANTDWYHYLYKDVRPNTSQDISFSGGNNQVRFYLSGNYYKEKGIVRSTPDVIQKYNFRSKVDFKINKWLRLSNNTSYYNENYWYPGRSGMNTYFSWDRVHALASFVPTNPDGTSVYRTSFTNYTIMDGLAAMTDKGLHGNSDKNDTMTTTTELSYNPVKGLTLVANFTYQFNTTRYTNRQVNVDYSLYPGEITTLTTGAYENKLTETIYNHNYNTINAFATYETEFGDGHNFKVMAGYNREEKRIKDVRAIGYNLLSESLIDLSLSTSEERSPEVSGGQNESAIAGFFGRINYDYKGRYLLEVSGRYDATSRFPKDIRWGFFPSFSVGWRISEENFFAPALKTVSNLKLRFSYGTLGNQNVGYYDYIRQVSIGTQSYLFGDGKPSIATINDPVYASNYSWEKAEHLNLGLEAGFLSERLNFTGDFYIRNTKDMLTTTKKLPATYGAAAPKGNAADLSTRGYELSLSWKDHFKLAGKSFFYNVTMTFNDYITEITKFDNPTKSLADAYYTGMRWGELWGLYTDGYFTSDQEAAAWLVDQTTVNNIINASADKGLKAGDIKFVDLNGDGVISKGQNTADDSGDYRVIGNTEPRFLYGITLGAAWNGIDFSIFFQGVGRRDWFPGHDNGMFWGAYARAFQTYLPKDFLNDVWSEDNPNAYFPRPRSYLAFADSKDRELTVPSDRYLQNIGYCRLKNLTVGYTLPYRWTSKIRIDRLRIYFSGENLATWSPLRSDYIDPEQANASANSKIYPYQKMFIFGVDLNF